ncbi:MAG: hypothetical protein J6X18_06510 [Bacteroidales bacterium]|nr:hypothetical protein [Bacteroidales bacterium]
MKELINWCKKYKVQLILLLCLALCIFGWCRTIQKNIDNRNRTEHNLEALTDTIRYYKGKNSELVATKSILEADYETLKTTNAELEEKIRNMKVDNPQQVVYVETTVEHEVHDTVWIVNLDTVIDKRFDFSNRWRSLNGNIRLENSRLGLSIAEDKVFLNYYLAIKDGRVYLTSDNPYVTFNEIQGLTVPTRKKYRFGVGIGPSITMSYNFMTNQPIFVPGISLGVYWNFIQF